MADQEPQEDSCVCSRRGLGTSAAVLAKFYGDHVTDHFDPFLEVFQKTYAFKREYTLQNDRPMAGKTLRGVDSLPGSCRRAVCAGDVNKRYH